MPTPSPPPSSTEPSEMIPCPPVQAQEKVQDEGVGPYVLETVAIVIVAAPDRAVLVACRIDLRDDRERVSLVVKRPASTDVGKVKLHGPAFAAAANPSHLETTMQHVSGEETFDGQRALHYPLIHVRVHSEAKTSMALLARIATTIISITWDGPLVFNDQVSSRLPPQLRRPTNNSSPDAKLGLQDGLADRPVDVAARPLLQSALPRDLILLGLLSSRRRAAIFASSARAARGQCLASLNPGHARPLLSDLLEENPALLGGGSRMLPLPLIILDIPPRHVGAGDHWLRSGKSPRPMSAVRLQWHATVLHLRPLLDHAVLETFGQVILHEGRKLRDVRERLHRWLLLGLAKGTLHLSEQVLKRHISNIATPSSLL
eukprot:5989338-Pyramimonas_sp.AAC.1